MNRSIGILILVILLAIFGIMVAVDIGTENYEQLGIYAAVGIVLYFFIHGWRNVWWFTALLIFSGVVFFHGFVFEADHLFAMMLALASLMFLVSRGAMYQVPEFLAAGSRTTAVIVGILLAYGTLHFAIYYAAPYSPADYAIKTSAKAYFECYASMACFFWMLIGPYGFKLKVSWPRTLLLVIVFGLAANVAVRAYMFYIGFQAADGLSTGTMEDYFLHVPVINMQAGIYTLRNICPLSCAIVLMIASTPGWWRSSSKRMKLLILSIIFLCFIGALFSGGRATLLFCMVIAFAVALMRRQIALISVMVCSGMLLIALVNVFSHEVNTRAPYYIARSMQMIMFEKGDSAGTIGESQETRNAAIQEALVQWRQDNRVLFFGRSVFRITHDEGVIARNQGIDGFVANAMRSGRTHNLITDLLLQYGLAGCMLYLLAYLSVIRFVFRLYRAIPWHQGMAKSLTGAMVIYLPMIFVYQFLGGTFMPSVVALVIGIVRAHLVTLRSPVSAPVPGEPVLRHGLSRSSAALARVDQA